MKTKIPTEGEHKTEEAENCNDIQCDTELSV